MKALFTITAALLLAVSLAYWSASLRYESEGRRGSPSARVLAYHQTLKSGEPNILRFYSTRALIARMGEDTAASYISGFESAISDYDKVKILEERSAEGAERSEVIAQAGSTVLRYDLIREDGEWYIAKVSWEDGTIVKGFDGTVTIFKTGSSGE